MFDRNKIIEYMNLKSWTKYRLAKSAGIAQSTLHDIVSGKNVAPNSNTLSKIATALGVTVNDFFNEPASDIKEEIPQEYLDKHKVTKRDINQYEDFKQSMGAFFMNDEVDDEDKDKLMKDIQDLFWEAKEINKKKYNPNKNKK
jgi:DNA-binding XRE family transcriptional regulator